MDEIPLGTLALALIVLLIVSGFFSLAETAMMAANRYRLKHQAQRGARGARLVLSLLAQTDKLLGVILLGNNLLNAACATLASLITVRLFGQGEWPLAVGTVVVTFLILVFSEITPKVVGAAHADRLAPLVSFFLAPLLRALRPIVWFVNLFVQGLLRLFRFRAAPQPSTTLSQEELRSLVLEGAQYFRGKHKTMLANLLDIEAVSVDDVMTPRSQIHALDLAEKPSLIRQQLATSYHTRLPVCEGSLDNIIGILAVKSMLHAMQGGELDVDNTKGYGPENIYWLQDDPGSNDEDAKIKGPGPPGEYKWFVVYWGGFGGLPKPTRWKVRIKHEGKLTVVNGKFRALNERSKIHTLTVKPTAVATP